MESFIDDTLEIINFSNEEAHSIKNTENIFNELVLNLSNFTGKIMYLDLIEIFKKLKVNDEFNEFVILRNNKIKMRYIDYKNEENAIFNKIKANPLIKNGNGLLNLLEN